ncbi:SGNH/GDSL hydrolase family protein [Altericista sp. CCNU0014]|uniref:SGNH/GDSL hydrolase family protein n=1 Tax=Altericista sp. CCNU0014 TaxID=3082949 RepID=UPI00384E67D8
MKKRIVFIILFLLTLFLTLMAVAVFSPKQAPSIRKLYVFGDSLSDTGTVFRSTYGLYPSNPPYFQGRFSNGRVWVEYLAEDLGVKQVGNFAWGGATTGDDATVLVPGLLSQVQTFTQQHSTATADELYILWAGANDYLQGTNNSALPVANITKAIEALARIGATRILVANLPDLGQLPATQGSDRSRELSQLTQAHNTGLRRSLKVLTQQNPELQVMTLDANLLYQQAVANPQKFGLNQVTRACLTGSDPCRNPERFLFWDNIHPTTAGHRILADTTVTALKTQLLFPR